MFLCRFHSSHRKIRLPKPAAKITHGLILTTFVSFDGKYVRYGIIDLSKISSVESTEPRMYALCGMPKCFLRSAVACHNCAVLSGRSQI